MKRILMAMTAAVLLGAGPTMALAQTPDYPTLTRDEELRLAISAGPLAVSEHADVYLMGAKGFSKAIDRHQRLGVHRRAGGRQQATARAALPESAGGPVGPAGVPA
ncbi:MAG TPA: hypothetical protein PKW63_11815 [Vicinamibacterales bacterium]|nr:hypothetical protein [Acidobacteriota bacterium]HQX82438.1 hypothetical protein [Vicinamibacterales bacterium]HQZ39654.1 hypothetical protein [Vicinamibacterales bacterium]